MSHRWSIPVRILAVLAAILVLMPSQAAEKKTAEPAVSTPLAELKNMSLDQKVAYWEKRRQERLVKMTPEQRQAMEKERQEMRDKIKNMTTVERKEFWRKQRNERMARFTPEERADHDAMRAMLKEMSPEDKKNFWEKRRQQRLAQMPPEKRKKFEERHQAMQEKMKNMTPEEKKEMRKDMHNMREYMDDDL